MHCSSTRHYKHPPTFGCALVDDSTCQKHQTAAPLGVSELYVVVSVHRDEFGKLRLQLQDVDNVTYRLPVTCDTLRQCFSPSHEDAEPHFGSLKQTSACVNPPDSEIILRVGLARGWSVETVIGIHVGAMLS